MAEPLVHLRQRAGENWLIGHDSHYFSQLSEQLWLDLTKQTKPGKPLKILLAEQDPILFLASFIAACAARSHIFLCNPHWVEREWQQVFDLVQPDLILGQKANFSPSFTHPSLPGSPRIMIPTGGSSGKIRFAIHSWETLMASVRGFQQYFGQKSVNSFCVLPLYHVSGLMQFLRSFTTGGRMVILPFQAIIKGEGQSIEPEPKDFFLSLVPTQLARLLSRDTSVWLSRFQTILLGGAPAWPSLLEESRHYQLRLAPTYGMTETASQIVTLQSEDFLRSNNSSGQVLPHAQVTIRSAKGEILAAGQTGIINIQADSLSLGYYPHLHSRIENISSDDLGFFDQQGYLHIIGRRSHKIVTGGENVFPAEVESVILATGLVKDVSIIGLPDKYWGQVVTAVYIPICPQVSTAKLQALVTNKLSNFKRPKYWLAVESLPRNGQGKVNYEHLKSICSKHFGNLYKEVN